jgi:ubiquinone biosynthesis protein
MVDAASGSRARRVRPLRDRLQPTTRRAGEVATVLSRYSLTTFFEFVALRLRTRKWHHSPVMPRLVRRSLEDLGPTFMKLGQVMSTRPDLVPPSFEQELSRLQDGAPPVAADHIVETIEQCLGRSISDAYAHFDPAPLAAASIGQVHAARLHDGTEVVVKVRRPNVDDSIEVDLALIERLAAIAGRRTFLDRYDPVGLAREFRVTMSGELDYIREAQNADAVAAAFADEPRVRVPAIIWSHTCDGVITEERVWGSKIDDRDALEAIGADPTAVARAFADAYLSMVFVQRLFHADPHPGNVFVEPDGRVAFVDFGMVGVVSHTTRLGLGKVLLALVAVDVTQMADGLFDLGIVRGSIDRAAFERDLERLLHRYAFVPLEQLRIGPLLNDVMSVVRKHGLRMPSDLALLLKTVMMCEGVAAQLDPGFELIPLLVPYAARLTVDDAAESAT